MRIWWYWLYHDDEVMKFINFIQYHLVSSSFLVLLVSLMITDHCHGVMLKFQTQKKINRWHVARCVCCRNWEAWRSLCGWLHCLKHERTWSTRQRWWTLSSVSHGTETTSRGSRRCNRGDQLGNFGCWKLSSFFRDWSEIVWVADLLLIDLNHSDDAPEQRSKKDTAFSVSRPCNLQWL